MTAANSRAARRANRVETLGVDATCKHCGEFEILCLRELKSGSEQLLLCANCQAALRKKRDTESHHVMGRNTGDLTVSITPNDHGILSDYQYDWPKETLRNPTGSPLRIIAALLRGWIDMLELVMQHARSWIHFLEELDPFLTERLGSAWWADLETLEQ